MRIVLASASPRRLRLLGRIVGRKKIKCIPAGIDERIRKGEGFPSACRRLALAKAEFAAKKDGTRSIVVGADTIAYRGREIFRKTDGRKEAERALRALSGKTHKVVTGVAVIFPGKKPIVYSVRALVKMRKIPPELLEWYLERNEWRGRAGSYDVSGKGSRLVAEVKGEKEAVIGLPLLKLRRLLADEI